MNKQTNTSLNISLDKNISKKLDKILSKAGDLSFKRRVISIIKYLDIKKGDVVLDAGCGEGFYTMILSQLYDCKIYAIDHDDEILNLAKSHINDNYIGKVVFSKENIYKLNFKDNFFDKIICSEVIEHLPDEKPALKELYRVLKKEGKVIFTVPSENYPFFWDPLNKIRYWLNLGHFSSYNRILGGVWSWGHYRLYTPNKLKNILENNKFKTLHLEVQTRYGLPFNLLLLNLGKLFYTKLPVPKDIKQSMEKFDYAKSKSSSNSIFSKLIGYIFNMFLWVDSFNNRKLDLSEPCMTVLAVVKK